MVFIVHDTEWLYTGICSSCCTWFDNLLHILHILTGPSGFTRNFPDYPATTRNLRLRLTPESAQGLSTKAKTYWEMR